MEYSGWRPLKGVSASPRTRIGDASKKKTDELLQIDIKIGAQIS